jgi:hypothetical protein
MNVIEARLRRFQSTDSRDIRDLSFVAEKPVVERSSAPGYMVMARLGLGTFLHPF